MRPVRITADRLEFEARIKLHGPLRRHKRMRWYGKLWERETSPRAPEDDPAAILWRPIRTGLQDAETHLVPLYHKSARCVFSFFLRMA
jgi:hypothetical protein